jgi:hypothetical protein
MEQEPGLHSNHPTPGLTHRRKDAANDRMPLGSWLETRGAGGWGGERRESEDSPWAQPKVRELRVMPTGLHVMK